MRRKDKQITDEDKIIEIIKANNVLRLGLANNNIPYIVPMNYGYKDNTFYLHCAKEGRKLDMLRQNPNVCFEIDQNHQLIEAEVPCKFSMKYQSIIGYAEAEIIDDYDGMSEAFKVIMSNFTNKEFDFPDMMLKNILIIKLKVKDLTAKGKY